jgi:spore coat protein H
MKFPVWSVGFGLALLASVLQVSAADIKPQESDAVFGPTKLWQIHLHVTAENWKSMQPPQGGFPGFGGPPGGGFGPPGSQPAPRPAMRPGSFGFEFEYVKATVEFDGKKLPDVGLRFKGNGTYAMSQPGRRRPMKIDFNRYEKDQKFHGLQQLNLHNDIMDPSHLRQVLSYSVFQDAGIPSPRTAFAEITLTIDGECDHEPLGLYTLVEEVDKAFLKRHYGSSKGMLLKPEGTQGLEYKGEDWKDYAWYEPKTDTSEGDQAALIALTRLIHKSDDDQFRREIGTLLDIDQFARFLAVNTLLSNMDSFLTQVHNYYLYLPPDTKKFEFLPWDMDLSMGAFFMAGNAEQLQDLSIRHPYMGQNRVIERLMEWDKFEAIYKQHLTQLTESQFAEGGLSLARLAELRNTMKPVFDREAERAAKAAAAAPRGPGGFGFGPPGGGNMFAGPSLETFFQKRRESITAQLAGTSKGREPGMSFGPPGGGFGGPPPGDFGPGTFHAPQFVAAGDTDGDKKVSKEEFDKLAGKWLTDWDKDSNKSLNLDELTKGLNAALAVPAPAGAPGGFRPPTGFGPGTFLARPLLRLADTDRDAAASDSEWKKLFEGWFPKWDKGMDGQLDEAEMLSGLNSAFAGPPPGGPPQRPQ